MKHPVTWATIIYALVQRLGGSVTFTAAELDAVSESPLASSIRLLDENNVAAASHRTAATAVIRNTTAAEAAAELRDTQQRLQRERLQHDRRLS